MPAASHKALYVDEHCEFSVRSGLKAHENGDGELLIETLFSGVNPADIKHSTILGYRSMVLGYDFCGRVLSAPAGSPFKDGDIVAGNGIPRIRRPLKYGAHQSVLVCPEEMVWKVPSNVPPSHAAALTVVAMTAADAMYNAFAKPMPGIRTTADPDKSPMLIWGASSSVGVCAVQLARASGVQNIFVTASPARHQLLLSLGATQCFDYASPTVVEDIRAAVEALGQGPLGCALDAVGSMASSPTSAEIVARCAPNPSTILAGVVALPSDSHGFRPLYGVPKEEFVMHFKGLPQPIVAPARPADHWRAWEALKWVIENYGKGFVLPSVDVIAGTAEEALIAVKQVGETGRGFGKTVIQHPMK
ncbi:GroES-like protein [Thozetella sp. PMI_491]|nr:GroES-like protein [Thozetella sp. PMI_491]